MNKGIIILVSVLMLLPAATFAQTSDTADAAVRVQLVTPPGAPAIPDTFWGRISSLLGVRRVAPVRPEVGTAFTVQSSAYASSPYQTDSTPCITAAGTTVRSGVVASNFLPLGTLLEINGQEFIVEDRMNSRYNGYYLDIWFPSTSSALQFGRRNLNIVVTGYVEPGHAIRAVEEPVEVAEEEDVGFATRVRDALYVVGALLRSGSPGVDRFDVDCLPGESPEVPLDLNAL